MNGSAESAKHPQRPENQPIGAFVGLPVRHQKLWSAISLRGENAGLQANPGNESASAKAHPSPSSAITNLIAGIGQAGSEVAAGSATAAETTNTDGPGNMGSHGANMRTRAPFR